MSLALAPDNIDRYGDEYGRDYGYDHDDYHPGSHLPFMRVGTVSDTALDGNSTLAGVDEITALKWKYQDKMVVMGLVFGSAIFVIVVVLVGSIFYGRIARARKTAMKPDHENGNGKKDHQGKRFPGAHAHPPPFYYGNQAPRDIPNENTARRQQIQSHHEQQFPAPVPAGGITVPSESSSEDISTISSFDRFMTAPTPPPLAKDTPREATLSPKTTGHDTPLPAYVAESAPASQSEKSQVIQLTSPELDAPAPAFLQPVRPGVEDHSAVAPALQDSAAPTINLRVPFDQWRFGV